uniref:Uncharacterized protein n=1 Tax=Lactuca sativa TaxID=4236 RepID=A0A9R1VEQ9_LACSA|nr:hypothetical protein LSAT_V11C500292980 [Lactuca sativa]
MAITWHQLGLLNASRMILSCCMRHSHRLRPKLTWLLLLLLLSLPNEMLNFNMKNLVIVGYHLAYELYKLKTIREKNSDCALNPWSIKCFYFLPETPENEVSSRKDQKELCNLTLKVSTLENEISICKMKMEQEILVVRQ